VLHRRRALPYHPNGMQFWAYDGAGQELRSRVYYSVGGGFVVDETAAGADRIKADDTPVRYPFRTAAELFGHCQATGLAVSGVMLANELSWRTEPEVRAGWPCTETAATSSPWTRSSRPCGRPAPT
jgi:L-serine dehydratase